jgi:hypothetical protein
MAPSHFTYGSHASMFVGFTPSVPGAARPYIDGKYAKLFRLGDIGFSNGKGGAFSLAGTTIIDGFNRLGYRTIGSGAVRWFDPQTDTGRQLSKDFSAFLYTGNTASLNRQIDWLASEIDRSAGSPIFAFLNIGETHVPYYFEGAPWSWSDNPCIPYQTSDRVQECRTRQRACLEYVDSQIVRLLSHFADSTVLICSDHGDCWGEDGLWEHGVSHEMTLAVPLLIRINGVPLTLETAY